MIPMNSSLDLDPIAAEALRDVFTTRFERHLVPVSLDEISEVPGDASWLISTVNLEGSQARGSVNLQVSESLMDLLNMFLGDCSNDPSERESERADLAGELCNMVAGRIGTNLAAAGHLFTLSTPDVYRGRALETGTDADKWGSCTGWTCAGGTLTLKISIQ
jgi:CheY-specific phosphatase CheX